MTGAEFIVELARWWLILGALVAAAFLTIGMDRVDEDARGAYAFRPLLIPGVLLIWPLVVWRWIRLERSLGHWSARYRALRTAHLPAALVLTAALVFATAASLAVRQSWPADIAPERLSEAPE